MRMQTKYKAAGNIEDSACFQVFGNKRMRLIIYMHRTSRKLLLLISTARSRQAVEQRL